MTSNPNNDSTEQYYAEMEAARNTAMDAYFIARPQILRTHALESIFRAGFERAFAMMWAASNAVREVTAVETTDARDAARYRIVRVSKLTGDVLAHELDAACDALIATRGAVEPTCLCAQKLDGQIIETHLACPIHGVNRDFTEEDKAIWLRISQRDHLDHLSYAGIYATADFCDAELMLNVTLYPHMLVTALAQEMNPNFKMPRPLARMAGKFCRVFSAT